MYSGMEMKRIFLDIETLPAKEELWKALPAEAREETGSKPKKGAGWKSKDAYRRTALSGEFGRILCIGLIVEQGDREDSLMLGWDEAANHFSEDEPALLRGFWNQMHDFDASTDLVIGHNVLDFDLRFIYQRSVVRRVKPSVELSFRRYSSRPVFDTMQEWGKWSRQDYISLDRLARALGLASSKSPAISGAQVYDRYVEGKHQLIRDYCLADVALTRQVYRRLAFAE